jgi:hypothetical protein
MRLGDAFAFLVGSVVVYVACAANHGDDTNSRDTGVADARADDASPAAFTVESIVCDQTTPAGIRWGERTFPGRSKEDLARVTALVCGDAPETIPGYSCVQTSLVVRDGAVAAGCRNLGTKVTLIVPSRP